MKKCNIRKLKSGEPLRCPLYNKKERLTREKSSSTATCTCGATVHSLVVCWSCCCFPLFPASAYRRSPALPHLSLPPSPVSPLSLTHARAHTQPCQHVTFFFFFFNKSNDYISLTVFTIVIFFVCVGNIWSFH